MIEHIRDNFVLFQLFLAYITIFFNFPNALLRI